MESRGIPWHGLREDQSAQKVLLVIALGLAFLAVLGWSLAWMQRAVISLQHELIQELKGHIRGLEERISIRISLDRHAVALDPADRQRLASLLHRASRRYAIEWHLLVAVVETESAFRPAATSGRGALGLMQIRPSTAAEVARALGVPYDGPADLYDMEVNIRLGTAYLHLLRRRFGTLDLALQAYNIGPTRLSAVTGQAGLSRASARAPRPESLDHARDPESIEGLGTKAEPSGAGSGLPSGVQRSLREAGIHESPGRSYAAKVLTRSRWLAPLSPGPSGQSAAHLPERR